MRLVRVVVPVIMVVVPFAVMVPEIIVSLVITAFVRIAF
jgi:hypothetical protein